VNDRIVLKTEALARSKTLLL